MIRGLVEGSITLEAEAATCRVLFSRAEPFFAGHFPGHPLVPGMIMLECLVGLGRRWLAAGDVSAVSEAKFRHEVPPDSELVCRVKRNGAELVGTVEAHGQIALEAYFTLEPR